MAAWRRLLEPVGLPVLIYALARLVDAVFLVVASRHQPALGPTTVPGMFVFQSHPADPGYLGMITNWDGQWYQAIATQGYPLHVADASPDELWRWAFPPGFPLLVGALMRVTGMSFAVAATVFNAVAGAGASIMLYALVDRVAGRFTALRAVVVTNAFISAPILQMAYSEAMALFLLVGALLALQRRRLWLGHCRDRRPGLHPAGHGSSGDRGSGAFLVPGSVPGLALGAPAGDGVGAYGRRGRHRGGVRVVVSSGRPWSARPG